MESRNPSTSTIANGSKPQVAFAALKHKDYRWFLIATMLAMMADNIEHVISYWVLFQKFQSPVLAGFAVISHWTPFLLLSVYFGGLADRYDCRKLIQIAQIMYMGVTGGLGDIVFDRHDSNLARLRAVDHSRHRRRVLDAGGDLDDS